MHREITDLFRRTFGAPPASVERVAADGSNRTYVRLRGGPHGSVIGGFGPDRDENRAFLSFTSTFRDLGLPVPELFAADEEAGIWLLEDFGDTTLFRALSVAREGADGSFAQEGGDDGFPDDVLRVYERVIDLLPRFQIEGGRAIDFSVAYPREAFDAQSMRWDLNYFKYHFLKLARIPFNEQRLEDDFERLIDFLLQADAGHFLYRDLQSRNILVKDGAPHFIDYQGGRRGALQYDVASLLYDAKAAIPERVRERLLARYLDALADRMLVDRDRFGELYLGFVLCRILQAMGSYGYRGFFERKPRFLESVPYAASNLGRLLENGLSVPLPELGRALGRIVEEWSAGTPSPTAAQGLAVHVSSFSYRNGIPTDDRGHGGGYVFDCRSLANPGRLEAFEDATGTDPEVIAFLEARPEVEEFWARVWSLVASHAATFRERGFGDMSVAFGCTGGQHRSVYFAERLVRALRERFADVEVTLRHHEQGRWPGAGRASGTRAR
ncbi:MAG: phosphotransferase enzyme family protein [Gemmatimonadetes bacterium]|nr:phosphotransferase enzyme family protein [Gemmatimonadota bacterium]